MFTSIVYDNNEAKMLSAQEPSNHAVNMLRGSEPYISSLVCSPGRDAVEL